MSSVNIMSNALILNMNSKHTVSAKHSLTACLFSYNIVAIKVIQLTFLSFCLSISKWVKVRERSLCKLITETIKAELTHETSVYILII